MVTYYSIKAVSANIKNILMYIQHKRYLLNAYISVKKNKKNKNFRVYRKKKIYIL